MMCWHPHLCELAHIGPGYGTNWQPYRDHKSAQGSLNAWWAWRTSWGVHDEGCSTLTGMHVVTASGLNLSLLMSESVLVLLNKAAVPSQSLNVAYVPYHRLQGWHETVQSGVHCSKACYH